MGEGAGTHEHRHVLRVRTHRRTRTDSASRLTFVLDAGTAAARVWICSALCLYWSQRSICF